MYFFRVPSPSAHWSTSLYMSVNNVYATNSFPKDNEPLIASADSNLLFGTQEQRSRERTLTACCSMGNFATIAFAFTVVTGQVVQYVTLPLWVDSTTQSTTTNQTAKWKPSLDSYFVVSFASLSFVIAFGFVILLCGCIYPKYLVKTDWSSCRLFLSVGFVQGVSALFIVFSSSGKRTPPYLQAILGNVNIPITMILR